MINKSFGVIIDKGIKNVLILGVTSIVPNMNGVLLFTEDGENHFIESCDLDRDEFDNDTRYLSLNSIIYPTGQFIDEAFQLAFEDPDLTEVIDHRSK